MKNMSEDELQVFFGSIICLFSGGVLTLFISLAVKIPASLTLL